jgi:hypothetical protein
MCSDLYFAELARWFDPNDSNLTEVLPNLEFMLPG